MPHFQAINIEAAKQFKEDRKGVKNQSPRECFFLVFMFPITGNASNLFTAQVTKPSLVLCLLCLSIHIL